MVATLAPSARQSTQATALRTITVPPLRDHGMPPRRAHTPSLFDIGTPLSVRTPKRRAGYAAQVWTDRGFWLLGTFPTTWDAKRAARTFGATDPVEPAAGTPRGELPLGWHWKRSDGHKPRDGNKWVRMVKGGAWQARPWLGAGHGSLNLGLFTIDDHGEFAEWAAAQVAAAFDREWQGSRTVAEVVERLKNAPRRSERVAAHVVVPERQCDLTRPTDEPSGSVPTAARDAAEREALWLSENLFGTVVTADEVLAAWHLARRKRRMEPEEFAEYAADFRQALAEGERYEDILELLAM